jgi:hypothetical protein
MALIDQAARAEQRGDVKDQMSALERARDRRLAQESAFSKLLLDAGAVDNTLDANRLAAQFAADTADYRLGRQITAGQTEGVLDRASREQVARIGAGATMAAAQLRANGRPDIPAGVRARLVSDVQEMRPAIETQVRRELGYKAVPKDPTALKNYQQRVQTLLQQAYNERLAQIAGMDVSAGAGQATNPFEDFSVVGTSR